MGVVYRASHAMLRRPTAIKLLADGARGGAGHRDIKPANVFLCRRWGEPDAVKVLDFGLAKNNADTRTSVTARDVVLGTPLYISPEALKT